MKKFMLLILLSVGIICGVTTELPVDNLSTVAYARSVNEPGKWHRGTPKVLRKAWKKLHYKGNGYYNFKVTHHTYTLAIGFAGVYAKNVSYEYLGNHIYELRGTDAEFPDHHAHVYVRYYSKHKVRTGTNIQSNSSKWRLWNH